MLQPLFYNRTCITTYCFRYLELGTPAVARGTSRLGSPYKGTLAALRFCNHHLCCAPHYSPNTMDAKQFTIASAFLVTVSFGL